MGVLGIHDPQLRGGAEATNTVTKFVAAGRLGHGDTLAGRHWQWVKDRAASVNDSNDEPPKLMVDNDF